MSRQRSRRDRRRRGGGVGLRRRHDSNTKRLARFVARNAVPLAASLAVAHAILSLLTFLPQPHTGGDNAAYITLGRSLLDHHALLSLWDPAQPPHTQYPPVFPGILAIAMAMGLESWAQLKLVMAVLSTAAVALSFLWIERRHRPLLALGAASILAFSPGVLEQGHWILSDVPFWCLTMLAVWSLDRLRPGQSGRFAIGVAATVLAYLTRSAGLPLLLAVTGWLALRRQWRHLAAFAAAALPFVLWWWLRARSQGGVDYVGQFWFVNPYAPELGRIGAVDLFDRVLENATKYVTIHLPILLIGTTGAIPVALSFGTFGLALFGWMRRLRRRALVELFLAFYIALLLVWPAVWSGERFLLPALPILLCYAGDALTRVISRLRRHALVPAGAAVVAIVVVAGVPAHIRAVRFSGECMYEYRTGDRYPCMAPAWRDFFETGDWAATALPDGAAVLSRKPRLFYVISGGHPGRNYPMSSDPAELVRAADDTGARHIVFDQLGRLSQEYLAPAVLGRITAYCIMHRSRNDRSPTLMLGVLSGADTVANTTQEQAANTTIEACDASYWRPGATPQVPPGGEGGGP